MLPQVAVLGSGIMGTGIAAFFADRGLPVTLFDVSVDLARKAIERAADPSARVPVLMSPRAAKLITPRSVEDYEAALGQADFIVEAVPEVMALKKKVYDAVDRHRKPGSIVCTNTSGLSVEAMAEGRSADFRAHFLGTHFFNPVRFMPLVEVIPGRDTKAEIVESVAAQLRMLGKKAVVAKDTPNFIANRIGIFSTLKAFELMEKYGLSLEAVDAITGEPMGNPRSATFRTADVVGLDTLAHVIETQGATAPPWLGRMLEEKKLGDKTGGGFYKKVGGEIQALDLRTFEYRPKQDPRFDAIRVARGYSRPRDRLRALLDYGDDDKVCSFARELALSAGAYALSLVGEVSDDARAIDEAVKWGFAREVGPIEALDVVGPARAAKLMQRYGIEVPAALTEAAAANRPVLPPRVAAPSAISLAALRERPKAIVRENVNARLVDLGDGVLCCELDHKMVPAMNPVDDYLISLFEQAHEEVRSGRFQALVIAKEGQNFCAGAQLDLVLRLAEEKRFDDIREIARRLQMVTLANRHAPFPVVVAAQGLALGGGCEILMSGQVRVVFAECYAGQVEVGVGLVPSGGGCLMLLQNMINRAKKRNPGPTPAVQQAFELIGFGRVSSSAADAMEKGFLNPKTDQVVFDRDDLLARAKDAALARLAAFEPIPKPDLLLPGPAAYYAFEDQVLSMVRQQKLSPHGARIAKVQARILTGGARASYAAPVPPEHILELEREGFVELCATKETQARIGHMLKTGKPLLN